MDIKLLPNGKSENRFVFPSLPEEIKVGNSAKYQSFNIISQGTVKVPKGTDVKDISWSGEFFGEAKKREALVKTQYYMAPDKCVKKLEDWMKDGTVLNLIVTGTWINIDVTISSFKATPYGAFGNVKYDISFEEVRELNIYTTKELKISGSSKKSKKKKKKKTKKRSKKKKAKVIKYAIKRNDTLYLVARTKLGNGDDWIRIYSKNKHILDGAAREKYSKSSDHGNILVPGTKITIP